MEPGGCFTRDKGRPQVPKSTGRPAPRFPFALSAIPVWLCLKFEKATRRSAHRPAMSICGERGSRWSSSPHRSRIAVGAPAAFCRRRPGTWRAATTGYDENNARDRGREDRIAEAIRDTCRTVEARLRELEVASAQPSR